MSNFGPDMENRADVMRRDAFIVGILGFGAANGMHFSPYYLPGLLLLEPFVKVTFFTTSGILELLHIARHLHPYGDDLRCSGCDLRAGDGAEGEQRDILWHLVRRHGAHHAADRHEHGLARRPLSRQAAPAWRFTQS